VLQGLSGVTVAQRIDSHARVEPLGGVETLGGVEKLGDTESIERRVGGTVPDR
jgi:hypothetical protein